MDLSPILQFFTANKDLIGFIFGSGTLFALGKFAWCFRQQPRKQLHNLQRYDDAISSYDKALEFKSDSHEA